MGIKATNFVVTSKQESVIKVEPVQVAELKGKINNLVVLNKKPAPVKDPGKDLKSLKGSKLVVDGKVKNISKKSAFLLDMLTLDDE